MNKTKVIENIIRNHSYNKRDLKAFTFIEVERNAGMWGNIFFDGSYVLFADDKVIWY